MQFKKLNRSRGLESKLRALDLARKLKCYLGMIKQQSQHHSLSLENRATRYFTLFFAGLALALGFNNCSKIKVSDTPVGQIASANGVAAADAVVTSSPAPTSNSSAGLISNCDDARKTGRISVQKVELTFENPGKACSWGTNGNLSILDGYVRARTEQEQIIQVAKDAKICNIQMTNADVQNFRYDDNIILTLNQFVLASTTNFGAHFDQSTGYQKYDWSKLVNKAAQNGQADSTPDKQYCAGYAQGLSSCQFPATETVGKADLHFDQRVIQSILGMTDPTQAKLGLVTTGDNDSTDCQHVPIRLLVDIEYFL